MSDPNTDLSPRRRDVPVFSIRRLWPVAVLLAGLVVFYAFDLGSYLNFEELRENREALLDLTADHQVLTALAFAGLYIVVVAFSLPGGAFLTITGGFLFGPLLGAAYVVVAATIGATILFLIAKTTLGDVLQHRAGPWLQRMEKGFQENAFSYLLVLRLIPLFPFFVVNLVPAFLGVSLRTYFLATLIGIIPGICAGRRRPWQHLRQRGSVHTVRHPDAGYPPGTCRSCASIARPDPVQEIEIEASEQVS